LQRLFARNRAGSASEGLAKTGLAKTGAASLGEARGIYAVCSANRYVLQACMQQALADESLLLVETTPNQVNQSGGYSGLTPAAFAAYLQALSGQMGFPLERLVLGGDHSGPHPWAAEPAPAAMARARRLVEQCVQAGYLKIHLDASMPLGGEAGSSMETCAARTAELCATAEAAAAAGPVRPLYVIGSEVPAPGGAREAAQELSPTSVESLQDTLAATREAFYARQLEEAWERVVAVVVQPGVEFGSDFVVRYDPRKAEQLSACIESWPRLVYEAHSTDYQPLEALRQLVAGHFAILKVGPALTFAFREAVFALSAMERELDGETRLPGILEQAMLDDPSHWRSYYQGDDSQLAFARRFSLSDRIRYYWTVPKVDRALNELIAKFERRPPPLALVSQYAPEQHGAIREGRIRNHPADLINDKIRRVARGYALACGLSAGSAE
jgi:D-tagatose-1,6-bisphosphate aldolase subunit GatZ/KbaZ